MKLLGATAEASSVRSIEEATAVVQMIIMSWLIVGNNPGDDEKLWDLLMIWMWYVREREHSTTFRFLF